MRMYLPVISLLSSFLFLCVLALQYPFSTTFPIGGDGARYILKLLEVKQLITQGDGIEAITALFTNTWYPGTQIILAISTLIPIAWPERFIWWMVLGHIFTASSLALVLYNLTGWKMAAAGLALWGLTITSLTSHIESGTLAQLWSLGFIALFLFFITKQSLIGTILFTFLAGLTHPFSGGVLLLTMTISTPALLIMRSWRFALLGIGSGILGLLVAMRYYEASTAFLEDSAPFILDNLLKSPFGPFLAFVPIGFIILITLNKSFPVPVVIIIHFIFVSLLFTFNDKLGIGTLASRFQSYGIMAIVLLAALGLPVILKNVFPFSSVRAIVVILLFVSSGLATWHDALPFFNFYESPSRYARLHPEEKAAIEWMDSHLPSGSVIVSTRANRHSDWIPILSKHTWIGLKQEEKLWHTPTQELSNYLQSLPYTHIVFFRHREKPSEVFSEGMSLFPTIFENRGAVVLELKHI